MTPPPLGVYLVDDHPVVRAGLRALLATQPDLRVVGEAEAPGPALEGIAATRPHVAVIDLLLKDGEGLDLIRRAACRFPRLGLMVLSVRSEEAYAGHALRAGARAYLCKDAAPGRILSAIRAIGRGSPWPPGPAAGRPHAVAALTDRELEVFHLLGRGKRVRDIAVATRLSPKTVESHCAKLRRKLALESLHALTRFAQRWEQSFGA